MPIRRRAPRKREVPGSAGILPAACAQLRCERRAGCPRSPISSRQAAGRAGNANREEVEILSPRPLGGEGGAQPPFSPGGAGRVRGSYSGPRYG